MITARSTHTATATDRSNAGLRAPMRRRHRPPVVLLLAVQAELRVRHGSEPRQVDLAAAILAGAERALADAHERRLDQGQLALLLAQQGQTLLVVGVTGDRVGRVVEVDPPVL